MDGKEPPLSILAFEMPLRVSVDSAVLRSAMSWRPGLLRIRCYFRRFFFDIGSYIFLAGARNPTTYEAIRVSVLYPGS